MFPRKGQSRAPLLAAGKEKASFRMDEDVDCWRWRMFEDIQVGLGDKIELVGMADGEKLAKLDFIEYIPN